MNFTAYSFTIHSLLMGSYEFSKYCKKMWQLHIKFMLIGI